MRLSLTIHLMNNRVEISIKEPECNYRKKLDFVTEAISTFILNFIIGCYRGLGRLFEVEVNSHSLIVRNYSKKGIQNILCCPFQFTGLSFCPTALSGNGYHCCPYLRKVWFCGSTEFKSMHNCVYPLITKHLCRCQHGRVVE